MRAFSIDIATEVPTNYFFTMSTRDIFRKSFSRSDRYVAIFLNEFANMKETSVLDTFVPLFEIRLGQLEIFGDGGIWSEASELLECGYKTSENLAAGMSASRRDVGVQT